MAYRFWSRKMYFFFFFNQANSWWCECTRRCRWGWAELAKRNTSRTEVIKAHSIEKKATIQLVLVIDYTWLYNIIYMWCTVRQYNVCHLYTSSSSVSALILQSSFSLRTWKSPSVLLVVLNGSKSEIYHAPFECSLRYGNPQRTWCARPGAWHPLPPRLACGAEHAGQGWSWEKPRTESKTNSLNHEDGCFKRRLVVCINIFWAFLLSPFWDGIQIDKYVSKACVVGRTILLCLRCSWVIPDRRTRPVRSTETVPSLLGCWEGFGWTCFASWKMSSIVKWVITVYLRISMNIVDKYIKTHHQISNVNMIHVKKKLQLADIWWFLCTTVLYYILYTVYIHNPSMPFWFNIQLAQGTGLNAQLFWQWLGRKPWRKETVLGCTVHRFITVFGCFLTKCQQKVWNVVGVCKSVWELLDVWVVFLLSVNEDILYIDDSSSPSFSLAL